MTTKEFGEFLKYIKDTLEIAHSKIDMRYLGAAAFKADIKTAIQKTQAKIEEVTGKNRDSGIRD